jgi:peptide/nickel transport system permease protein
VRDLAHKPSAWISAGWILAVVLASIFAQWVAPHNPYTQDITRNLALPTASHWLGTDSLGRDILSRLIYGGNLALISCVEVVVVALVIGVPLGLVAGYFGGWVDAIVARIADVFLAIPAIIVLMAVVAVVGNNLTLAMITLGVIISANYIRMVRGSTLAVRRELFIDAAQVSGLRAARIILRHVLPNVIAPLIIISTLTFGIALLVQSGLAFIGLAVQPPAANWGAMIYEASQYIYQDPWLMVPAGGALILTILAFNTLGDALNAAQAGSVSISPAGQFRAQGRRDRRTRDGVEATRDPSGVLLRAKGLTVVAGSEANPTALVENLSFEVREGEVLGLVGESGSGKTMTARAIIGLLPPGCRVQSGTIEFAGRDLTASESVAAAHRGTKIALISQEPMVALDPSFTIGSQLREPLRLHKRMSRAEAKVEALALLRKVGIDRPEAVYASFPHQISGGMAQRVCIAIALTGQPELLIADEPTTALDVTVQAEILDLLRSLTDEFHMSLILVTHNLGVIADIADRTVVMYAGEVVEQCSTEELFAAPRHPYTAGLMASSPDRAELGKPLGAIAGIVPPPEQWPVSCHFADRCPIATEACRQAPIPLVAVGKDRESRCIRTDEAMTLGAPR